MIFDHRTYTVKAGTIKKQFELYEEHGWEVQTRHLGQPIVYAGTEVGNVNTYGAEAGYLIGQENKILVSVPFYTPPAEFKALDDA